MLWVAHPSEDALAPAISPAISPASTLTRPALPLYPTAMTGEPHSASYYAATRNDLTERPALRGDLEADVCVVGGGFTGVSTALNLAERGYDVVLLEANRIGWGASGRNGGQVCSGFSAGMDAIEGWVGKDDARLLFGIAEEAKGIIRDRVERHAIDCDLRWGYFNAAAKPRQLDWMRKAEAVWSRDYGYGDYDLLDTPEAARAHVNSEAYIGGLHDGGAGHLHPLNYCLGLARAAAAAGARLFEDSAVTDLRGAGGKAPPPAAPVAVTARGSVKARFLVLAGNAYLGGLLPRIRRKIMPMGNYIGATATLGEKRARALIPGDAAVADWNFILNYFRFSADHRLLFGGLASYSTLPPPNLHGALKTLMTGVFPGLDDVAFEHVWGGLVAITVERTPHLGRLGDSVYFAHGFSGNGVALTGVAGKILAEAIAGQAERLDLFARLPHTTFPGGRLLRMPTLVLAMTWYRLRDWLT